MSLWHDCTGVRNELALDGDVRNEDCCPDCHRNGTLAVMAIPEDGQPGWVVKTCCTMTAAIVDRLDAYVVDDSLLHASLIHRPLLVARTA